MLALPPTTQPALPLLSAIARLLSSDRSFAARMHDLFVLLREAVAFHDGRLVCWLQSAQPASLREQFYTPNGWHDAWNDDLTRQVAQRGAPVRLTIADAVLLNGDAPDLPGEITYFGAPMTGTGGSGVCWSCARPAPMRSAMASRRLSPRCCRCWPRRSRSRAALAMCRRCRGAPAS